MGSLCSLYYLATPGLDPRFPELSGRFKEDGMNQLPRGIMAHLQQIDPDNFMLILTDTIHKCDLDWERHEIPSNIQSRAARLRFIRKRVDSFGDSIKEIL